MRATSPFPPFDGEIHALAWGFRTSADMGIFGELWNFLTNATIVMALSRKPVILAGPVQTGPARDRDDLPACCSARR
ncbi:MAG: hypothetical protein V4793_19555, partial [Paraburkholderia tropica]